MRCSRQDHIDLTDFLSGSLYTYKLGYDGYNCIFNLVTKPGNQTINVSTIPDYCESFYIGEPNMYFACTSGVWTAKILQAPVLSYKDPRGCTKIHFYKGEVQALCSNDIVTIN